MRFLFDWQHLSQDAQVSGPEALAGILAQLEGYEAPAAVWETELLPARVGDYTMAWLDDLCTAGRTVWTRLRPPPGRPNPGNLRSTPLLLLPRKNMMPWIRLAPPPEADTAASPRGQRVLDFLNAQGASFYDEIAEGTRLLRSELEDALAELVMRGSVHCDSYAGLRTLLVPASRRALPAARRRRAASFSGIQDAGRWALVRRSTQTPASPAGQAPVDAAAASRGANAEAVEHVARALLRRYGVVCWRLLEREAPWLPPWRDLIRVYHRLEARGEIRGGRFVAGLTGEQFALPEAIASLRLVRRRNALPQWTCLSAADPANLLGSLLPGARIPRIAGARVLYRAGIAVATLMAGRVQWLASIGADEEPLARNLLLRGPGWPQSGGAQGTPLAQAQSAIPPARA
jgi:ATP-dependent Lhr-like helicase